VGIRALPTRREAAAILRVLARPSEVPADWSERTTMTTSRLETGGLEQASMVIRDLTRHATRSGKRLSSAENGVLQGCLNSVSSELALVLEMSQDDARALILQTAGGEA
jgi:RNA polymerase-interacting CarD/CdnL/TRCF family regulator